MPVPDPDRGRNRHAAGQHSASSGATIRAGPVWWRRLVLPGHSPPAWRVQSLRFVVVLRGSFQRKEHLGTTIIRRTCHHNRHLRRSAEGGASKDGATDGRSRKHGECPARSPLDTRGADEEIRMCAATGHRRTEPSAAVFRGSSGVEQAAVNRWVAGSNPARGAIPPCGGVAQLVRALACHARGRRFESGHSRHFRVPSPMRRLHTSARKGQHRGWSTRV